MGQISQRIRTAQTPVGDWYLFPGTDKTTPAFRYTLWQMAQRLGGDVNAYAAVISLESGFKADAYNKHGGATGLIQFMPATAKRLGTTTSALRSMSAVQQLVYVEKFYANAKGVTDPGTLYMLTFLPAYARRGDSFVLGEKDSSEVLDGGLTKGAVYAGNYGFDSDKDGVFTVGDVKSKARGRYNAAKNRGSIPITSVRAGREGGFIGALLVAALAIPFAIRVTR